MLTRRTFLASSMAALPLSARTRIGISRISAITDEIARSSQAAIDFAKQYGLRWVELRDVPGQNKEYSYLPENELHAEAELLEKNGIRVSFLNTSLMKVRIPGLEPVRWKRYTPAQREQRIKADLPKFERRMDDLRKCLHAGRILGVDKIRIFTGWRCADPDAAMPRIAEIINEMAVVAARERMHLLVENEPACNVATCRELAEIVRRLPSKWVGINWDPLNATAYNEAPYPDGYRLLPGKRVLNVQIKGKSILNYPEKLDWRAILDALDRDGYKGEIGLETHIFGDGQIQASHDSMEAILKLLKA